MVKADYILFKYKRNLLLLSLFLVCQEMQDSVQDYSDYFQSSACLTGIQHLYG